MAASSTLLTPVVATWITPFTAYFLLLSVRVTRLRIKTRTALGDRTRIWSDSSKPDETTPLSAAGPSTDTNVVAQLDPMNADKLTLAVRAHANYAENIPWCFLAAGICELNGGNSTALHIAMGLLLAGRVAHVEHGLKGKNTLGRGRVLGMSMTWNFMAAVSLYSAWLVKGHWGF